MTPESIRPVPRTRTPSEPLLFGFVLALNSLIYLILIADRRALPGDAFQLLDPLVFFFEETVFLGGIWLLSRRHFAAVQTRFVVAAAAAGSSMWADQRGFSIHGFFLVPLAITFLHHVLESGRRRHLGLASLLLAVQAAWKPAGLGLISALAVIGYFAGHAVVFGFPLLRRLRSIGLRKTDALWAVPIVLSGVLSAVLASASAAGPAASGLEGSAIRSALGSLGIDSPLSFLDLALGLSPSKDFTLYCGFATLLFSALAFVGTLRGRGFRLALFLLAAMAVLAVAATLLGFVCPHLAGLSPIVVGPPLFRLVLIFLAGYGLDGLLRGGSRVGCPEAGLARRFLVVAALPLLVSIAGQLVPEFAPRLAFLMSSGLGADRIWSEFAEPASLTEFTGAVAVCSVLTAGTFLLWASGPRLAPWALALMLVLHPLDVFGWKFRIFWLKTERADAREAAEESVGRSGGTRTLPHRGYGSPVRRAGTVFRPGEGFGIRRRPGRPCAQASWPPLRFARPSVPAPPRDERTLP